MVRSFCSLLFVVSLMGCATGKCLQAANAEAAAKAPVSAASSPVKETMKPESKLDRVKVYKADGSLQCGQGKPIAVTEMQKELGNIKVYSSENKNDGRMRIQVCGSPTGLNNVYEIDRKDLEAALKKGFKEWTFDN